MNRFKNIFKNKPSIIGMIHLEALPGTPNYNGSIRKIIDKSLKQLDIYLDNDIDGILVENMNDVPYVKKSGSEIVAAMTRVCSEIRSRLKSSGVPCGLQVLAGCNWEAVSIALACELQFIRAEGFVFGHVGDEGYFDANAGELLRHRRRIGAEHVAVFTDVKKKHSSHAITADVNLVQTAKAAEFFLSDGVILTGTATGEPADLDELKALKRHVKLPILIGSGVTANNVRDYLEADGLIIGSHFKKAGDWKNDIDIESVKNFTNEIKKYR